MNPMTAILIVLSLSVAAGDDARDKPATMVTTKPEPCEAAIAAGDDCIPRLAYPPRQSQQIPAALRHSRVPDEGPLPHQVPANYLGRQRQRQLDPDAAPVAAALRASRPSRQRSEGLQ